MATILFPKFEKKIAINCRCGRRIVKSVPVLALKKDEYVYMIREEAMNHELTFPPAKEDVIVKVKFSSVVVECECGREFEMQGGTLRNLTDSTDLKNKPVIKKKTKTEVMETFHDYTHDPHGSIN